MGIEVVKWPPYSHILNPIEDAWRHPRERVNEYHPKLEIITDGDDMIK